jgi:hypothetical protein
MRSSGACGSVVAALVFAIGCGTGGGTLSGAGGGTLSGAGGGGILTGQGGVGLGGGTGGRAGYPGTDCAAVPWPAPHVPADVLIVLDTAASMNDPIDGPCATDCAPRSKWAAAVGAINESVRATSSVNWGLAFMASAAPDDACDSGGVAIPVGSPSYQIGQGLAGRSDGAALSGGGNRPTRAAVRLGAAHLAGRPPGPRKIILLVTDGVPTCTPGAPDGLAADAEGAVKAITDAAGSGISTFVLGLATAGGPADATLDAMAAAGGLARPAPPGYAYAVRRADVVVGIDLLVSLTSLCTFAVPEVPTNDGTLSRTSIRVDAGATPIPQDRVNGWTYTDESLNAIELHGAACDAVRNGTSGPIGISFQCIVP